MSQINANAILDANGGNTATINSMTPTAESLQGFRNRIINGDMRIDARNAGASVSIPDDTTTYTVDRFAIYENTSGALSAQQDSSAPTGFNNSLKITVTTADASIAANDRALFRQRIEGFNVADLGFGTANAKTVTLSFWVRSSLTGTFGGSLMNGASDRSYPFSYSISVADTWEQKSVTIAGDTTGTWLTTNGIGLQVNWSLAAGTDDAGTAGAWVGATKRGVTGQVQVISTLNATWYITGVQLEVGSVATPFERRPFGTELALCQRYYETNFPLGTAPAPNINIEPSNVGSISYNGNTTRTTPCWYKVTKRANPTVTLYSPAGYANSNSNSFNIYISPTWYNYGGTPNSNNAGFILDGSSSGGSGSTGSAYLTAGNWSASAEL